jgi:hypothetical protein
MLSSGILRRVAIVRTDVSVEHIASIITVLKIGELETTLAVTSNRRTLQRNIIAFRSSRCSSSSSSSGSGSGSGSGSSSTVQML